MKQKGFTLIEILVVIAVVGILAFFLFANVMGTVQKARDRQRKSDLQQIKTALELYRIDHDIYKIANSGATLLADRWTYLGQYCAAGTAGSFKDASSGKVYMQKVPCDPIPGSLAYWNGGSYYYYSSLDGMTYVLAACIENQNDTDPNVTSSDPTIDLNGDPTTTGTCKSNKYFVLRNP